MSFSSTNKGKHTSSSSSSGFFSAKGLLTIILLLGLFIYLKRHPSSKTLKSESKSPILLSIESFLSSLPSYVTSLYQSVVHLLQIVYSRLSELNIYGYIDQWKDLSENRPIFGIVMVSVISVVVIVGILFALYKLCKFFLQISDQTESSAHLHKSPSLSSLRVEKRNNPKEYCHTIVLIYRSKHKRVSAFVPSFVEETISIVPFV